MMKAISIITIFSFVFAVECRYVDDGSEVLYLDDPEIANQTYPENLESLFKTSETLSCSTIDAIEAKNVIIGKNYRWKNFNVYMDPRYTNEERLLIQSAMKRLKDVVPCVKFGIWPKGSQPTGDYVHIKRGRGCLSLIGRQGGPQEMTLESPGCMKSGLIIHEILHALGFHHEQSRPDRDDYVTIHYENIQQGMQINFQKADRNAFGTEGVPYNEKSLMHYRSTDFSANGRPTISSKRGIAVGSTGELQQTDIQKLKKAYNC